MAVMDYKKSMCVGPETPVKPTAYYVSCMCDATTQIAEGVSASRFPDRFISERVPASLFSVLLAMTRSLCTSFFALFRACIPLLVALGMASALVGCGAFQESIRNETDLAAQFLPTTRTVASFDSLQRVAISPNEDGRLELETEDSFGTIWVAWSARHRQTQGPELFETNRFSSFATLWGRELRLAELNRLTPLDAYAPAQARRAVQQEVDSLHHEQIRVDVYLYVPERVEEAFQYTSIRHMGARSFLRINEESAEHPAQFVDTDIVRYTTRSGEGVFYRRNTLIFPRRTEDGTDILADAERITLHVRSVSFPRAHLRFAWERDDG